LDDWWLARRTKSRRMMRTRKTKRVTQEALKIKPRPWGLKTGQIFLKTSAGADQQSREGGKNLQLWQT